MAVTTRISRQRAAEARSDTADVSRARCGWSSHGRLGRQAYGEPTAIEATKRQPRTAAVHERKFGMNEGKTTMIKIIKDSL